MISLRRIYLGLQLLLAAFLFASCTTSQDENILRLGTTTSVENAGLLNAILPEFENTFQARVDVIAVGTGQALALGELGDVDIVLVHAPALEDAFVAAGYGIERVPVMYNDFIIVGPKDDPALIINSLSAADALNKIQNSGSIFVSRGDNSGTHIRELEIWIEAPPENEEWYLSVGQGMGAALNIANQEAAYIFTDRGTYLAQSKNLPNLLILFGGNSTLENSDPQLRNIYSVIRINDELYPKTNVSLAKDFEKWITSLNVQEQIGEFREQYFGQTLFYPNSTIWQMATEDDSPLQSVSDGDEREDSGGANLIGEWGEILAVVSRTIQVSGSALIIACLFGIPLGMFMGLDNFKGKKIVQTIIYTGMGLPPVVVGLVVFLLLSNNGILGNLGWLFTPSGMILAQAILAFPLAAGLTSAAVGEVPKTLILQIRSMGATIGQERWTVFQQAKSGILAAVVAALGRIVAEVGAVMLVGGNIYGQTRVLSTAIVLETRQGSFSQALALGMVLLGIALLANVIALRLAGRWRM